MSLALQEDRLNKKLTMNKSSDMENELIKGQVTTNMGSQQESMHQTLPSLGQRMNLMNNQQVYTSPKT